MSRQSRGASLSVSWPCGHTLALAAAMLLLLTGTLEFVARRDLVRQRLPWSLGTVSAQFELKLRRLDAIVEREGIPDCFFVGNSTVNRDLDPEAFAAGFHSRTGRTIRCFNLGIDGVPGTTVTLLTRFLSANYGPRLFVFGVTPASSGLRIDSNAGIAESRWLRYRLGAHDIRGWLIAHSALCRLYLGCRSWLTPRFNQAWRAVDAALTPDGYRRIDDVFRPPDPPPPAPPGAPGPVLRKLPPVDLRDLEEMLAFGESRRTIAVELPLHPEFLTLFGRFRENYATAAAAAGRLAASRHVPFWRIAPRGLVPDDGWSDLRHMNVKGAAVFSQWLGEQVGTAVRTGVLADPTDVE